MKKRFLKALAGIAVLGALWLLCIGGICLARRSRAKAFKAACCEAKPALEEMAADGGSVLGIAAAESLESLGGDGAGRAMPCILSAVMFDTGRGYGLLVVQWISDDQDDVTGLGIDDGFWPAQRLPYNTMERWMKSGPLHTYAGIVVRGYVPLSLFSEVHPLGEAFGVKLVKHSKQRSVHPLGEAFGATETRPCTALENGGTADVCLLDGRLRHDGSRQVVKWLMPSEQLKLAWHGFAATGGAK